MSTPKLVTADAGEWVSRQVMPHRGVGRGLDSSSGSGGGPVSERDPFRAAAATAELGTPDARRSGRWANRPWVPVVRLDGRQAQVMRLAYRTRVEAVTAAEGHIERCRRHLEVQLRRPNMRALREAHGLARELDDVAALSAGVAR